MKFAMMAFNGGNGRNPADVYRENLEQARYAEELGFDAVWLTEHHFSDYALLGDPTLFASALAETTSRIRHRHGSPRAARAQPDPGRREHRVRRRPQLGTSRRRHRPRLPAERVRRLRRADGALAGHDGRVDGADPPALDPGGRRLPGRVLHAARVHAVPATRAGAASPGLARGGQPGHVRACRRAGPGDPHVSELHAHPADPGELRRVSQRAHRERLRRPRTTSSR